jgi:Molecular chaperone, HSP90 family
MSDDTKSSVRFKPELGEHNIREAIESDSVSNTYEFEVEAETVFKRLAEDIYNGKEAGIREPLTNGITAVFRAIEEGYIDDASEGIILFELYESDDTKRLKIRDNGVGMTRDEIDEVVSVIGTSTSRSSSNLTGKFGMGFLATWMLAGGVEGGFIMHTNPRGVDEEPISGIWNSNSFSEMSDGELEGGLESDDYGTEFDIMVSLNIEISELIQWINKYSEWSRIPILFRHILMMVSQMKNLHQNIFLICIKILKIMKKM